MKKILTFLVFGLLFSVVSAQYNKNIFDQENVYVYDLKNLESDLKKNYTDYQCAITQEDGAARKCTTYKMKGAPDQAVRNYIYYLRTKQLNKAASIANTKLGTAYQYPFQISNTIIFNSFVIPFHEGLLGFDIYDQGGFAKLAYITIKGGKLYKFRSNAYFIEGSTEELLDPMKKSGYSNLIVYGSGLVKIGSINIKIPYKFIQGEDGILTLTIDKNWYRNYLVGKLPSKELDTRTNAFKLKIKKLFH